MTAPTPEQLEAFLDDLARLSRRPGLMLSGEAVIAPAADRFGGYLASSEGRMKPWMTDAPLQAEGVVVSVDVSPEGTEHRAAAWRQESAAAIEAYNRAFDRNRVSTTELYQASWAEQKQASWLREGAAQEGLRSGPFLCRR